MAFSMLHSILGRRVGVSSSGGIVSGFGSTGNHSTAFGMAAQMWGDALVNSHTSSGDVLRNSGVSIVAPASATASTFLISAPVKGVLKASW